jgi:peptidoglycan hydrolase-like protein with peptidoglycan-binding domain
VACTSLARWEKSGKGDAGERLPERARALVKRALYEFEGLHGFHDGLLEAVRAVGDTPLTPEAAREVVEAATTHAALALGLLETVRDRDEVVQGRAMETAAKLLNLEFTGTAQDEVSRMRQALDQALCADKVLIEGIGHRFEELLHPRGRGGEWIKGLQKPGDKGGGDLPPEAGKFYSAHVQGAQARLKILRPHPRRPGWWEAENVTTGGRVRVTPDMLTPESGDKGGGESGKLDRGAPVRLRGGPKKWSVFEDHGNGYVTISHGQAFDQVKKKVLRRDLTPWGGDKGGGGVRKQITRINLVPGGEGDKGDPGRQRTGDPKIDKLIEEFLRTPMGDWTSDDNTYEALRDPERSHGACQEVTDHFVEFAKARGFKAYSTNTDMEEMGYTPQIKPFGEVGFDDHGEMQYGFYPEHTIATIVVDDPAYKYGREFYIDFTASQYGYKEHPKVTESLDEETYWRLCSDVVALRTVMLFEADDREQRKLRANAAALVERMRYLAPGEFDAVPRVTDEMLAESVEVTFEPVLNILFEAGQALAAKPPPVSSDPVTRAHQVTGTKPGETGVPNADFERVHPRSRGGVFAKKGDGLGAQASNPTVKQLQARLSAMGYRVVQDGQFGTVTEQAVKAFQKDHGLPESGHADARTAAAMRDPGAGVHNRQTAGTAAGTAAGKKGSSSASSSSTGVSLGKAGMLRRGDGMGPGAKPSNEVAVLQQTLDSMGYEVGVGGADGRFGEDTQAAIEMIQRRYGLRVDGVVGSQTADLIHRLMTARAKQGRQDGQLSVDEMPSKGVTPNKVPKGTSGRRAAKKKAAPKLPKQVTVAAAPAATGGQSLSAGSRLQHAASTAEEEQDMEDVALVEVTFDPSKHARGRGGKFAEMLGHAAEAWKSGKAYLDNSGNYRLKSEGGNSRRGQVAPWNKAVKSAFPKHDDFARAIDPAAAKSHDEAMARLNRFEVKSVGGEHHVIDNQDGGRIVAKHKSFAGARKKAQKLGDAQPGGRDEQEAKWREIRGEQPRSPATTRLQSDAIDRSRRVHNANVAKDEAAAGKWHGQDVSSGKLVPVEEMHLLSDEQVQQLIDRATNPRTQQAPAEWASAVAREANKRKAKLREASFSSGGFDTNSPVQQKSGGVNGLNGGGANGEALPGGRTSGTDDVWGGSRATRPPGLRESPADSFASCATCVHHNGARLCALYSAGTDPDDLCDSWFTLTPVEARTTATMLLARFDRGEGGQVDEAARADLIRDGWARLEESVLDLPETASVARGMLSQGATVAQARVEATQVVARRVLDRERRGLFGHDLEEAAGAKKVKCPKCDTVQAATNKACVKCGKPMQGMGGKLNESLLNAAGGVLDDWLAESTLTAEARKKLPKDAFAVPPDKYPIHDEAHARNALARVAQHGSPKEKAMVRRKVKQRHPKIVQEALDLIACEVCALDEDSQGLAWSLLEAADSMVKATVHEPVGKPGGKGLWGHKGMQLPAYIQHIANDLREKRGMTTSRAVATAIAAVKRWAVGGGKVDATTHAAAIKAVAEWEALKAASHAHLKESGVLSEAGMVIHFDPHLHPRSRKGEFIDVLGRLMQGHRGGEVTLPHGVSVRKQGGLLVVRDGGGPAGVYRNPAKAAAKALKQTGIPSPKHTSADMGIRTPRFAIAFDKGDPSTPGWTKVEAATGRFPAHHRTLPNGRSEMLTKLPGEDHWRHIGMTRTGNVDALRAVPDAEARQMIAGEQGGHVVHLQSVGLHPAKPASEFVPGDHVVYNFGVTGEVTKVEPKGNSVALTTRSADGREFTSTKRGSTLLGHSLRSYNGAEKGGGEFRVSWYDGRPPEGHTWGVGDKAFWNGRNVEIISKLGTVSGAEQNYGIKFEDGHVNWAKHSELSLPYTGDKSGGRGGSWGDTEGGQDATRGREAPIRSGAQPIPAATLRGGGLDEIRHTVVYRKQDGSYRETGVSARDSNHARELAARIIPENATITQAFPESDSTKSVGEMTDVELRTALGTISDRLVMHAQSGDRQGANAATIVSGQITQEMERRRGDEAQAQAQALANRMAWGEKGGGSYAQQAETEMWDAIAGQDARPVVASPPLPDASELKHMSDAQITDLVERVIPQARGAVHDQSVPGEFRQKLAAEANKRNTRRYQGGGGDNVEAQGTMKPTLTSGGFSQNAPGYGSRGYETPKGRVTLSLNSIPKEWMIEHGYAVKTEHKATAAWAGRQPSKAYTSIDYKTGLDVERVWMHYLTGAVPKNPLEGTNKAAQFRYTGKGGTKATRAALARRLTEASLPALAVVLGLTEYRQHAIVGRLDRIEDTAVTMVRLPVAEFIVEARASDNDLVAATVEVLRGRLAEVAPDADRRLQEAAPGDERKLYATICGALA